MPKYGPAPFDSCDLSDDQIIDKLKCDFISTAGSPLTEKQARRFRVILKARRPFVAWVFLSENRLFISRYVEAALVQGLQDDLHDPIEDHPEYSDLIKRVGEEALDQVKREAGPGLGLCHAVWGSMATILRERHGIVWYSPSEMNPLTMYD